RGVALMALICCWLACSAAAQVVPDGRREPRSPPSPLPGNQNPVEAPAEIASPPPPMETMALAPHRKTLQQAFLRVPHL
uniref:Uncharacterized protein n=2 Tax=Aegilops tauschii TaxID=37682 RepID=A0A453DP71_AEGTS